MRPSCVQFAGTFIYLHLFGTCLCTTTVKHYRHDSTATFMSDAFKTYSNMNKTRCFAACTETTLYYYVSYDEIHALCMLSSWNADGRTVADGWSLFRLAPPGPDIDDYFSVGNYSIAISSQGVAKTEAESLCASSGFGRLVEIRTIQMYLAISDYLMNMSQDLKDLYGDIWMAGEYNSGAYRFPDDSLLPITPANNHDTSGSAICLVLDKTTSYKYDDKHCHFCPATCVNAYNAVHDPTCHMPLD